MAEEKGHIPQGVSRAIVGGETRSTGGLCRSAQVRAVAAANREFDELYRRFGRSTVERLKAHGRGKSVAERLAGDVQVTVAGKTSFTQTKLWRMRTFHLASTEEAKNLPRPMASTPWGHNANLLGEVKGPGARTRHARTAQDHARPCTRRPPIARQTDGGIGAPSDLPPAAS